MTNHDSHTKDLTTLISDSDSLLSALLRGFSLSDAKAGDREYLVYVLSADVITNAFAVLQAVEDDAVPAARCIAGLQCRSLIHAAWVSTVATKTWIRKFMATYATNPPEGLVRSTKEMFEALPRSLGDASSAILSDLSISDALFYDQESSGGLWSICEGEKFRDLTAERALRQANSMAVLAALLVSKASGSADVESYMNRMAKTYSSCLTEQVAEFFSSAPDAAVLNNVLEIA